MTHSLVNSCGPFKAYNHRQLDSIPELKMLPRELLFDMQVVSQVFPFRVNNYVIKELINWHNVPEDPVFRLTFPQKNMLKPTHFQVMAALVNSNASQNEINTAVRQIRAELNPHPAGQLDANLPEFNGLKLNGIQHKYKETVLFFPSQGQVCHSYCNFCFRWAQFIGDKNLRIAANEAETLYDYLASNKEATDLLITGGDPMVMKASILRKYVIGVTKPELDHIQNIRFGSKSLSFWPYRFINDRDSDELLKLFQDLTSAGKHVAFMAHFNHWQEMQTDACREAIKRIRATGVEIRTQSPLVRCINDSPEIWAKMWKLQVKWGLVPYYMFVERDTGADHYFAVPLVRAWEIYQKAIKQVSGICRTARGPVMSTDPGKIEIQGVTSINGEKVFVLRFIQGRNPNWVQRPFIAKIDEEATWINHLKPYEGKQFFFE